MSETTAAQPTDGQSVTERFRAARDQLLRLRTDLDAAVAAVRESPPGAVWRPVVWRRVVSVRGAARAGGR